MALPLLMLAGTLLRASGPTIVKQLMKMGAKKATKTAIKNAPKNIKTVTSKTICCYYKTRWHERQTKWVSHS